VHMARNKEHRGRVLALERFFHVLSGDDAFVVVDQDDIDGVAELHKMVNAPPADGENDYDQQSVAESKFSSQATHLRSRKLKALFRQRTNRVERQVQFKHVYTRLAQHAKLSSFSVLVNYRAHLIDAHSSLFGDARDLELGGRWSDMRVETRTRRGHKIH